MTAYGEPRFWLERFPLGEAALFSFPSVYGAVRSAYADHRQQRASLVEQLADLDSGPPSCSAPAGELNLDGVPWHDSRRLSLERLLPAAQMGRLLTIIDINLGRKNGRLSSLMVGRLLRGQEDARMDDFLKIVQASDLSALSNTLTPELLTFLRQMLA